MDEADVKAKVDLVWDRFILNTTTYAHQRQLDGDWRFLRAYNGKCAHEPRHLGSQCPDKHPIPLTKRIVFDHLNGTETIGVYQVHLGQVKWLCLDLDINKHQPPDADPEALRETVEHLSHLLMARLRDLRVPYLRELSGSRGIHLWVFFAEPVPALWARELGNHILKDVAIPEALHVELFPKQTFAVMTGNLVKLPLGVHRKTGNRCKFLRPDDTPMTFAECWEALRAVKPVTRASMEKFHDHVGHTYTNDVASTAGETQEYGLACFTKIMREGVVAGARDVGTFYLALYLKHQGLPEDLVRATMERWNSQVNDPPLDDYRLNQKITSAFAANYSMYPCNHREFDVYCSPSCKFYASRMKSRGKKK